MAFYVTKSLLSKFNKITYPSNTLPVYEESVNSDHWQYLSDGKKQVQLSKDPICRVCAKHATMSLSNKIDGCDLMSAIRSIANITIETDDSLPKFICTACLENLKVAMAFRADCVAADKRFRKILNPLGDPAFHSYPYSKNDFQSILHKMRKRQMDVVEELEKVRQEKEKVMKKKTPKTKQFKCSPCDLIFPTKEKLVDHRRERQCMRRACDVCGQLVVSIATHMRQIHKKDAIYKCDTCGKEFNLLARLKNHMMVHTNTFNFFCDLCPYKCKHKYYLVTHMRTHTGEKPYKCTHCDATFVNPSNLNKHNLTHQEKQYKCKICEKAFRTSSALRVHREATHLNIKHRCNLCGRDFCYKSDLRKHEVRTHNREKRSFIGGEPAYKQWERTQKMHDEPATDRWRTEEIQLTSMPVVQTYIEQPKEYLQSAHTIYFPDVSGLIQQPTMVQQQTVQITLPDLNLKKDEVTLYESEHYF